MPTLFHGSKQPPTSFSEDGRGQGMEANSALGVWLTRDPENAARYAGPEGWVLTVEIPDMRLAFADNWTVTVWGDPSFNEDWREEAWGMFDKSRSELMNRGYGGLWCHMPGTDLAGAVCVFAPNDCKIVGKTPSAAHADLRPLGHGFVVDMEMKLDYVLAEFKEEALTLSW